MFKIKWTKRGAADYKELTEAAASVQKQRKGKKGKTSKQEGLFKQVHKAIGLLKSNPKHPGLQTHEFTSIPHPFSPNEKVFEAYAQNQTPGAYRIFWCYGPGVKEITIIAITPHP
jgi:hypothetical protein